MDVTGRKEAEIEAARQRAELGHLSRVALVGEMATSLAHELNQPLTAIVTNASAAQRFIARGDLNPTELSEMLADIGDDGRRASEVIRGIKGMVRRAESKRDSLNLNEVIADVLRLVRADAIAHGDCAQTAARPGALDDGLLLWAANFGGHTTQDQRNRPRPYAVASMQRQGRQGDTFCL
jgi:C4-dicarboxylate-specific signal transduction histidine kinase